MLFAVLVQIVLSGDRRHCPGKMHLKLPGYSIGYMVVQQVIVYRIIYINQNLT